MLGDPTAAELKKRDMDWLVSVNLSPEVGIAPFAGRDSLEYLGGHGRGEVVDGEVVRAAHRAAASGYIEGVWGIYRICIGEKADYWYIRMGTTRGRSWKDYESVATWDSPRAQKWRLSILFIQPPAKESKAGDRAQIW